MKAVIVILAAIALSALPILASDDMMVHDHCSQFTPCQDCVSQALCGWCSMPVIYKDGSKGKQCAGFNSNGSKPFECPGQYSTETCLRGYECNQENFTCTATAPGHGKSQPECESNCTNHGQIYLCNHTDKVCHVVSPGTPGGTSLAVCDASCIHPSHHPSSSSPSPTPNTTLYKCNFTSGQCAEAGAGQGSSKSACEAECKSTAGKDYYCASFDHTCQKLPPGQPGGESHSDCLKACAPPTPKPNPPQTFKTGLYRGIEVQKGYKTGEFDLDVNTTSVTMVSMYSGEAKKVVTGKPYHIGTSPNLIIKITSGADSGKYIYTEEFTTGQPGPETAFMAIAFSAPGATAAPASIKSAWTTTGEKVYALAACLSADCLFTLPTGAGAGADQTPGLMSRALAAGGMADFDDHCAQYSQSCTQCIANTYCGWCSVNVTYQGGTEGTQCAGFNGPNSKSTPFVCPGHYSTEKCNVGYTCDEVNYQCVETSKGNGHPKEVCEILCKPTPPPTPMPSMYQCNTTTKQCTKCDNSSCPGGLPEGPCQAACVHPKKGPHASLVGNWRGIYIQLDYHHIEVEMTITNVSLSVFHDKVFQYEANVTSYGADAMKLNIVKGKNTGYTFGATYQYEAQDAEYEMMTYARGVFGSTFPASFNTAMKTGGMEVLVLAKCQGAPCKFPELTA